MWIYIGHSPLQPPVPGDHRGKAPYVSAEKVLLFNIDIEKLFILKSKGIDSIHTSCKGVNQANVGFCVRLIERAGMAGKVYNV